VPAGTFEVRVQFLGYRAEARPGVVVTGGKATTLTFTLEEIVTEMLTATTSERQGRVIDHDENASMERKKREGYF